jgi:short-subunit dehydrogenase
VYHEFGVQVSLVEPGAIKSAFWQNVERPDISKIADDLKPVVQRITDVYRYAANLLIVYFFV